jgi:predicted homoserine dehydrogenase-like protein
MTPLFRHLQRLQASGTPIRVGVIGAGLMGRGLVHQLVRMPGLQPSVIVARNIEHALAAARDAGFAAESVVVTDDPVRFAKAAWANRLVITTDIELAAEVAPVDAYIECTGAVEYGAKAALACIRNGRHVVSLNAETDATVGCLLKHEADQAGVVYTNSDGDQPGVLMRLIEYCRACGLDVRTAVNCKGFMDVRATPESVMPWAIRQKTSPRMTASFTDGTKLNIEMNVVANATGLLPARRGMIGVRTDLKNALKDFRDAGALPGAPSVDYTLGGDFGGGVFVIARADDPRVAAPYFRYFKMGDGPDYLFFRPYHLCQIEAPLSAAEAVLYREPTIAPLGRPIAQTVALAKRPLKAGEFLDGIGGFTCYGEVDTAENVRGLLPIGLAEDIRLVRDVAQGEPIPLDAVELDDRRLLVRLWRQQELEARHATSIAA